MFSSFNFYDRQVNIIKEILMEDPFFDYLDKEQELIDQGLKQSFLPFSDENPDFIPVDPEEFKKFH